MVSWRDYVPREDHAEFIKNEQGYTYYESVKFYSTQRESDRIMVLSKRLEFLSKWIKEHGYQDKQK